ncbi:unnamed protein product [Haemonchus placei]|uniref:Uncharacterized protein n=1 Tax=Haemonchus placei TaxID=6290 RepID=A0A3P7URN7_HAEPC|nr:unnamed protein product [Haemonchus placei]
MFSFVYSILYKLFLLKRQNIRFPLKALTMKPTSLLSTMTSIRKQHFCSTTGTMFVPMELQLIQMTSENILIKNSFAVSLGIMRTHWIDSTGCYNRLGVLLENNTVSHRENQF